MRREKTAGAAKRRMAFQYAAGGMPDAALQAEKGGGREIRLRDKTKPAKAPAGGLRAKPTARPGAAGILFKKGYPFYPLVDTKG